MNKVRSTTLMNLKATKYLKTAIGFAAFMGTASISFAQDTGTLNGEDPTKSLEQNRTQTEAELNALQSETVQITSTLKRLENDIQSLKKDRDALETKLSTAEQRQNILDERIVTGEEKLTELEDREAIVKSSLRERNNVLAEVLAALQRLGSNPPPALLVSPEDALSSVRSAILLGAVVPEIRSETQKLLTDLQELADIRTEITSERTQLAADLDKSFKEQEELTALIKEKAALNIASLTQLEKERKRANELEDKSSELKTVVAALTTEITSIREAAEIARLDKIERQKKAAEQLARAKELAEARMLPNQERLMPAYSFAALQSTLQFPINGAVEKRFGDKDNSGQTLRGMLISATENDRVLAPVDGWITYAGPFRTYENIIILNAGEGYHIVMAGLDQLKVTQGQFVISGEPIATMGRESFTNNSALTLASGKPTLYIELRKDQTPIDSAPWWANIAFGRASNDT
ncbi:MAG: peptidoglycan DD-metalloendopeptidase family protein [Lentilitoribacter sp.]